MLIQRHGVSNHRYLSCLFNDLFMLTSKERPTRGWNTCVCVRVCEMHQHNRPLIKNNKQCEQPSITVQTLTHCGRVTHICVGNLTIIGSDNGLSPGRRQAIIWNNAGILLIELLRTNFSEILIEIMKFSLKKMRLQASSAKWRPFFLGLNVLSYKHGSLNTLSSLIKLPDRPMSTGNVLFKMATGNRAIGSSGRNL